MMHLHVLEKGTFPVSARFSCLVQDACAVFILFQRAFSTRLDPVPLAQDQYNSLLKELPQSPGHILGASLKLRSCTKQAEPQAAPKDPKLRSFNWKWNSPVWLLHVSDFCFEPSHSRLFSFELVARFGRLCLRFRYVRGVRGPCLVSTLELFEVWSTFGRGSGAWDHSVIRLHQRIGSHYGWFESPRTETSLLVVSHIAVGDVQYVSCIWALIKTTSPRDDHWGKSPNKKRVMPWEKYPWSKLGA